jgi:hypothetical protein
VVVPITGSSWGFLDAGLVSPDCYSKVIPGYGNVGSIALYNAKKVVAQFSQ